MAKPSSSNAANSELQTRGDAQAQENAEKDAAANASQSVAPPVAPSFKRTKNIAVSLFKLVPDKACYFLVDGAMFIGKKVDEKKDAATLLAVTDLTTGEQGQIIIGTVLKALLEETYPANSYVGKKLEIVLRKNADKKYNNYNVYEIE